MLATLILLFAPAWAQTCPGDVREVLSCSSVVSGQLTAGPWSGAASPTIGDPGWVDMQSFDNDLGDSCVWRSIGPFSTWDCDNTNLYECGGTTDYGQEGPEHVYEFTCQQDGFVDVLITDLDCDLDAYILDDSCDPVNGCEAESVLYTVTDDSISFFCTAGNTYYVVVEGFGFTYNGWYSYVFIPSLTGQPPDPGYCGPEFGTIRGNYTLEFVPGDPVTSGCVELCDNLVDDDGNGDVDCDDAACAADPYCNAVEDCFNGTDDDGDGDIDCADPDCFAEPTCCDDDGDGFIDPACGGGDCNDTVFHLPEADGDGVPDACDPCPSESFETDGDLDGSWSCDDCDDTRANVLPGGTEVCDGLDNDCAGGIDDGLTVTDYWVDDDGDGYGEEGSTPLSTCDGAPAGYVADDTDCDDAASAVNPGAVEVCDGLDNDCAGGIDDGLTVTDYWVDDDGDGYGEEGSTPLSTCDGAPAGYVADDTDCDDAASAVNPGAVEVCDGLDNDCAGGIDDGLTVTDYWVDDDGDGYGEEGSTPLSTCDGAPAGYVADDTDCDDAASAVNPGAVEICDGLDNDCAGGIDDGLTVTDYWVDDDGDGYGEEGSTPLSTCDGAPAGYVADDTDCDDAASAVNPGAVEVCDGLDNDCAGGIDDGLTVTDYWVDDDGDGYGEEGSTPLSTCDGAPAGYAADDTDCDDAASAVNPGAVEVCDGLDNDCAGGIDDGLTVTDYWVDDDGDGYGEEGSTPLSTCDGAPAGYAADDTDCDDVLATVNPGAPELCDGLDNDCNGLSDDGVVSASYWPDDDGDGYGDVGGAPVSTCDGPPAGTVADDTDCDDTLDTVNPGAAEVCDGLDNDCSGVADDGVAYASYWPDNDGDGYGDLGGAPVSTCDGPPVGTVADDTDCDDTLYTVNPGAAEVCDGIDNDCSGVADDGIPLTDYWPDNDGDGYGDGSAVPVGACDGAPAGTVADDSDCDDTRADLNPSDVDLDGVSSCDGDCADGDANRAPGLAEVVDGVDQDCDGIVDEGTEAYDDDGDGFTELAGDCDDGDAAISPAATEVCDGVDQDCDLLIDEGTECYDDDLDGTSELEGDCHDGDAAIGPDVNEVDDNLIDDDCDGVVDDGVRDDDDDGFGAGEDCDDADASVHPGANETANGIDDDCDGEVDEDTEVSDDDGDGASEEDGDCDDSDPSVSPSATETANGRDDDCDGEVDEDTEVSDDDGDGVSEAAGDCDDADASVSPAEPEVANGIDDDCDGEVDEGQDDADGDGVTVEEGDCDDTTGWVRPGLAETCGDGLDNDCSGVADDGCLDASAGPPVPEGCGCASTPAPAGSLPLVFGGLLLWMRRRRAGLSAVAAVAAMAGCKSENGLRQTPSRLEVSPGILDAGDVAVGGEAELVLQVDHLEGVSIELRRATLTHWEGEAFEVELPDGILLEAGRSLELPVHFRPDERGWHRSQLSITHDGVDSPAAVELRGHAVEPQVIVGPPVLDFGPVDPGDQADGELFVANQGVLPVTVDSIELPDGVTLDGDTLPRELGGGEQVVWALRYTADGAPLSGWARVYDGVGDVLGTVDLWANDCARGVPGLYDQDGDGVTSCGGDCDDLDPEVVPGAAEVPDGVDQDCDGEVDEDTSATDDDGDGFCEAGCTDGSLPGDCHDGDAAVAPDASEIQGNGIDDDCDGEVDASVVDADNDGWGESVDCDDTDASVHPGAPEIANGIDDNCIDGIDEGTTASDDDGDGASEAEGDCDDSDPTVGLGQPEVADGRDQDCDGLVDEGTSAYDDDGDGYTENGGDCDDDDALVYPAQGC